MREAGIEVIASGGVGNVRHLIEGITEGKADAVLAAGIFHFGEIAIQGRYETGFQPAADPRRCRSRRHPRHRLRRGRQCPAPD